MRRKEFSTKLKISETRKHPVRTEDNAAFNHIRRIEKIKKLITKFSPAPAPIFIFESKSIIYVYTECLRVLQENIGENLKEYIEKYTGFKPISELHLFSMDKVLEVDLDKKDCIDCPQKLVKEFEMKNFFLPKTPICTKKGDAWEITDEKREKTYYVIRKEEEKLCIYNKPIDFDKIKRELLENIRRTNEQGVINQGIQLRDGLIPEKIQTKLEEELQHDIDKIKDILISCEEKDIDYVWEWIYWKEKDFFWGDEFSIVRIQKGCDMLDCQVNNEVIILADDSTGDSWSRAGELKKEFENAGVSKCEVVTHSKVDTSDCIIYAADKDACEKYATTLEENSLDKKILFLMYPSSPLRLDKDKLPATWLDIRFEGFNIPEEITLNFMKGFFEVLRELLEKGEEKEVSVSEIIRKTRKKCGSLWRFAYIVNGNPYTKLTIRH